jgi:hypothetical protein
MTAYEDYWWRQRAADAAFAASEDNTDTLPAEERAAGIGEDEDEWPRS